PGTGIAPAAVRVVDACDGEIARPAQLAFDAVCAGPGGRSAVGDEFGAIFSREAAVAVGDSRRGRDGIVVTGPDVGGRADQVAIVEEEAVLVARPSERHGPLLKIAGGDGRREIGVTPLLRRIGAGGGRRLPGGVGAL